MGQKRKRYKTFDEAKKSKMRNLKKNINRKAPSDLKFVSRKKRPMTSIEQIMEEVLKDIGDEFRVEVEREYPIQFCNQWKFFDFRVGKRLLIECDGSYWHGDPNVVKERKMWMLENKKNDLMKNFIAKRNGFVLLRFWEHEINLQIDDVTNKIRETLSSMQNPKQIVDKGD